MNSPVVVLQFKGNDTIDEVYKLTLKSIDDLVTVALNGNANLEELRRKIGSWDAQVYNEIARRKFGPLPKFNNETGSFERKIF